MASRELRCLLAACLISALVVVACVGLTACKSTNVLTEITLDQDEGWLDETLDPLYEQDEDSDPDEERSSDQVSDSSRIDEQEEEDPEYDDEETDEEDETEEQDYSEETNNDTDATEGTEASDEEGSNAGSTNSGGLLSSILTSVTGATGSGEGSGGTGTGTSLSTEEDDDSDDEGDEGGAQKEDSSTSTPGSSNSSGSGNNAGVSTVEAGTVVSYDGSDSDVVHVASIAAYGQYALIVQMLGGEGALAATNSSWLSEMEEGGAFPGELDDVAIGFSNSGVADADAIIDSGAESVLYDPDEVTISTDDKEALLEAGIDIVEMSLDLDSTGTVDSNIIMAVQYIGEMLTNSTDGLSTRRADMYVSLHDEVLSNVASANGGSASYKVVGGDSWARFYQEDVSGTPGTAAAYAMCFVDSWGVFSVSSFTGNAKWYATVGPNLHNMTVDCSDGVGLSASGDGGYVLMDYYFQYAGVMDVSFEGKSPAKTSSGDSAIYTIGYATPSSTSGVYVTPTAYSRSATYAEALWFNKYYKTDTTKGWVTVGDDDYPAIVVRNSTYAKAIVSSAAKSNGYYNVAQSYEVYVMPDGVAGSWADGTVESFLIAPWAYCMYQEDGDLSSCTDYINTFYEYFYRCSQADAYESGLLSGYGTVYSAG